MWAFDADQGAIDYAANRYPSMDYVVMNALDIKFPAASFDIVLSFEVLEHLTKSEQREVPERNVARPAPGGVGPVDPQPGCLFRWVTPSR